jgi:hypothetical protein
MKCPYKRKEECKELNTLVMTCIPCKECDWFNNGVKETGGVIIGEILKSIWMWIKIPLFFIGLFVYLFTLLIWLYIRQGWFRIKSKEAYQSEVCRQNIWLDKL